MTSMNLVLRPSVREGRHPGSLSLRIIHNRRVKTVTLPGCRLFTPKNGAGRHRKSFSLEVNTATRNVYKLAHGKKGRNNKDYNILKKLK